MGKRALLLLAALVGLQGCVQYKMYNWGQYEESLYAFYRNPNASDDYLAALASVCEPATDKGIERGENAKRIPGPGLHAEFGFALMERQRFTEAVRQFETEKRLWPESAPFMDTLIKLAQNDGPRDKKQPILTPADKGVAKPKPAQAPQASKKEAAP